LIRQVHDPLNGGFGRIELFLPHDLQPRLLKPEGFQLNYGSEPKVSNRSLTHVS
jgi:hypothetical protein